MTGPAGRPTGRWGRRLLVGVAMTIVAAVAATAGVLVASHDPGDGPPASTAVAADPGPGCGIEPPPRNYFGAAPTSEAVFALAAGASFWDPQARGQNLSLVAYADGTVVTLSDSGGWQPELPLPMVGWVGRCAVAEARDQLARAATVGFGTPGMTDAATALLMFDPFADVRGATVEIYALDRDPDVFAGEEPIAARRTVRAVLSGLRDTANANASPRLEPRYRLQRYEGVTTSTDPTVAAWPLSTSIAEVVGPAGCAEVAPSIVNALQTARPEGRPVAQWADGSGTTVLAVSVLMPGEPACPPRPTPWR